MAAKGSKSRRGRGKPPAEPDTEVQPVEAQPVEAQPVEAQPGEPALDADPEERSTESAADEAPAGGEDTAPPHEPEEAATAFEPGEPHEPEPPATGRQSYRLAAGVAVVLLLAGLAAVWFYGTGGDRGRLDRQAQRLDGLATQAETQANRLGAAEEAIAGLQSQVGEVAAAVSRLDTSVGELRSAAEANRQTLDQLAEGIEALRSAAAVPADGAAAGEAAAQLRGLIETLAGRVASLEQEDQFGNLTASIARLDEEISELREQATGRVEQAQAATALGQAYAGLVGRIAAGQPFADELEAVTARLPSAPGLEALRPYAGTGVPTVSDLQARLAETVAELPQEPDDTAAADGIWPAVRQRLEGMVTVRRSDEADLPAVLARAAAALERGDVAAAITEVEQVEQGAPGKLEAWLADARMRRDVEAGLQELAAAVLRQLAGQR